MNTKTADGLILLGPGFQEGPVIDCLVAWRESGLAVWLVGVREVVVGQHGLTVRADHTLSTLPAHVAGRYLLLPGGQKCARTLLTDPRVHRLVRLTERQGGCIAALPAARRELKQMGLWSAEGFYEPPLAKANPFALPYPATPRPRTVLAAGHPAW